MRKNNITKSIAMIIAAGMMMTSFTGCGSSEAPASSDTSSNSGSNATSSNHSNHTMEEQATTAASDTAEYEYAAECEDSDGGYSMSAAAPQGRSATQSASAAATTKNDSYGFTGWNNYEASDSRKYSHVAENDFISTARENTSTFAADVDTASYSNIRNYINDRASVPADAVRIEEMINYFHYDYKEPKKGEPFSVNMEVDKCPWNPDHQLVMIGLKAKEIDESHRKPTNFVFLIDTSGSMNQSNKLPLVKCAYVKLLNELGEDDTVSIVTYAGSDKVLLEGESGANTDRIAEAIENLEAHGSTNGSAGINTAYEIAEKYFKKKGNNRVILATDGDLNVGVTSKDELTQLITKKKESGIFLSVLGFGNDNLKDDKLEAIADNGNGNYAFIDSVYEAKRVLVEEMGSTLETVAKDVKLQAEFDEDVVEKYRLIGYENRLLAKEDFDNDAVDGGEIGSGHEVTALYEIIPSKNADFKNNNHILDLDIRYKEPKEDDSKLLKYACKYSKNGFDNDPSDNMLWVESVAAFGMLLKESDYAGDDSLKLAYELADRTNYTSDALRVEYMSLLKDVDNYYSGFFYDDDDYGYRDYDDDYDYNDVTEIEAD